MNPAVIQSLKASIEALRFELGEHDADEALRADMLEGSTSIDDVVSHLVKVRQRAKADACGARAAKAESAKHYDRRIEVADAIECRMDKLLIEVMDAAGVTKFAVPEGKVSIAPPRGSISVNDVFALPQGYFETTRKPITDAIKRALLEGAKIPGASLQYGERSVRIV